MVRVDKEIGGRCAGVQWRFVVVGLGTGGKANGRYEFTCVGRVHLLLVNSTAVIGAGRDASGTKATADPASWLDLACIWLMEPADTPEVRKQKLRLGAFGFRLACG
jgi:hypothetical protein